MRILVVDDEFVSLSKMVTLLSRYGRCDAAENGEEAYDLYLKQMASVQPYSLVMADIEMPGMNGFALLSLIAKDEEQRKVFKRSKKIIISSHSTRDNVINARYNGCDTFLVKPLEPVPLETKLKELGLL